MARVPFAGLRRWLRIWRLPGEPRIAEFRCEPHAAVEGGTFTLVWKVDGASVVTLSPYIGEVPATGTVRVPADPQGPAAWVLTAAARGGRTSRTLARPPVLQAHITTAPATSHLSPLPAVQQRLPHAVPLPSRVRHTAMRRGATPVPAVIRPGVHLRVQPAVPTPDLSGPETTA